MVRAATVEARFLATYEPAEVAELPFDPFDMADYGVMMRGFWRHFDADFKGATRKVA